MVHLLVKEPQPALGVTCLALNLVFCEANGPIHHIVPPAVAFLSLTSHAISLLGSSMDRQYLMRNLVPRRIIATITRPPRLGFFVRRTSGRGRQHPQRQLTHPSVDWSAATFKVRYLTVKSVVGVFGTTRHAEDERRHETVGCTNHRGEMGSLDLRGEHPIRHRA